MIFTAWSHDGEWYGLRISKKDRDEYFPKNIPVVNLELPLNNEYIKIQVKVSSSFWNNCPELRGAKIRNWFNDCGYAAPNNTEPPKFQAVVVDETTIRILKNAE